MCHIPYKLIIGQVEFGTGAIVVWALPPLARQEQELLGIDARKSRSRVPSEQHFNSLAPLVAGHAKLYKNLSIILLQGDLG